MKQKPWRPAEVEKLMRLYREVTATQKYAMWPGIVAQMPGRTLGQCQGKVRYQICGKQYREKYANYKVGKQNHFASAVVAIPADVAADAARRRWLPRATLTAEFCGDPLPGYSALDRMARR